MYSIEQNWHTYSSSAKFDCIYKIYENHEFRLLIIYSIGLYGVISSKSIKESKAFIKRSRAYETLFKHLHF